MRISGFMVPENKAATGFPSDPIKAALEDMIKKKIGAIVVVSESIPTEAVGILTKTDFINAYQNGQSLDAPLLSIMSSSLLTLDENLSRDDAADFFLKKKVHHAVVTDSKGKFVGIVSSWDVSAETAKDGKAWPYPRSEDGRFHKFDPAADAKADPAVCRPRRESHTFLDYIDSIRDLQYEAF